MTSKHEEMIFQLMARDRKVAEAIVNDYSVRWMSMKPPLTQIEEALLEMAKNVLEIN